MRRMAIVNGDVVADDKLDTKERTAAASSRGFAGLPREPEDMRQSTPAASKFMQVSNCRSMHVQGPFDCMQRSFMRSAGEV